MRRFSKKRAAQERRMKKVQAELDDNPDNWSCWFFPEDPRTEYHHIIPRSYNTSLIDCKENQLPIGRRAHDILTFGTRDQIKALPKMVILLQRMADLDYSYYRRFAVKLNFEPLPK